MTAARGSGDIEERRCMEREKKRRQRAERKAAAEAEAGTDNGRAALLEALEGDTLLLPIPLGDDDDMRVRLRMVADYLREDHRHWPDERTGKRLLESDPAPTDLEILAAWAALTMWQSQTIGDAREHMRARGARRRADERVRTG